MTLHASHDIFSGKEVGWKLPVTSYINMINDDAKVKVYVTAKVVETGQFFAKHDIYDIEKPDLDIKVAPAPYLSYH